MIKGGVWLSSGGAIEQALRLARNMILARVLAPEAFGLMAIILAVNAAFDSFTQIGIKEAIIQNPDAEVDTYLNGAWWLSFGRSIGLLILGVIGSIWIADFYHISNDLGILQLSFLSILFNGALSSRAYIAVKKMEYKKWVLISHGGGICGIVTSIICSLLFRNVLALVIGFVVEAGARCMLSFIICPFLPRFRFAKENLRPLFAYARGMFGLPILYFIYAQAAVFVMGRLLPQNEIGFYSLAASLAQAPSQLITAILNQILMPAFSLKQNDKVWLNQTILRSTKLIVLTGIPLALFVALYARDLLTLIYGEYYGAAAIPFAILFFTSLLGTFGIPIVNVYLATGVPRLHRLFSGIRAVIIVLLIYPAIRWLGLSGAAMAVFIAMAVSYFFQVMRMHKMTGLDILQYGRAFIHGVSISSLVVVIWLLINNIFSEKPLNNLIYGATGCALAYGVWGAIYFKPGNLKGLLSFERNP